MSCSQPEPASRASATNSPNIKQAARFNDTDNSKTGGDPPLLSLSATLPTCEITRQNGSSVTSPLRSPVRNDTKLAYRRASLRPPEPVHATTTPYATNAPSASPAAATAVVAVDDAHLMSLIERFLVLLMPSTERLVRLRAALRGMRDGLGGPLLATSISSASPAISLSPPYDLSMRSSPRPSGTNIDVTVATAAATAGLPRLCVTGVSDVDMDEVFQFLLHRDPAAAAFGGSTSFGGGTNGGSGGACSALQSVSSTVRPPTPDNGWLASSHLSPLGPVLQRRLRMEALDTTGNVTADGLTTGSEVNTSPSVLPCASAAMAVSISGLLSSSNATLSDGVSEMEGGGPGSDFPSTPPPPPPSGFARIMTDMSRGRASPHLTDSPSPEHFALPMLHHHSESGILKTATQDKGAEMPEDTCGTPHPPSAPHSVFVNNSTNAATATTAAKANVGLASSAPLAGSANAALRLPAAPSSAVLPQPRSISPHPPLHFNGLYVENGISGGNGGGGSGLVSPATVGVVHMSPSPPLPAAPANHHLRSVKPTLSLESRTLPSLPAPTSLHSAGDAPDVAMLPPSTHGECADETTTTTAAVVVALAGNATTNFSSTLPDLGDTPPPTALTVSAVVNSSVSLSSTPAVVAHAPTSTPPLPVSAPLHGLGGGGGSNTSVASCPPSPGDFSESVFAPHSSSGAGFRRRPVPHSSLPTVAVLQAVESPATPAPIVTVLLHRTASQHSETSEHQRSFLGSSPSPGTGRYSALPAPFFSHVSGVSGAASSTGRSLRDDSTILSPGSSFSPAAARFVQRLRRRTVAFSLATLRLSAWDLFHPESLTPQDCALLRAARSSFAAVASQERMGRGSKGSFAPKRTSGDDGANGPSCGGGNVDHPRVLNRRGSPQLLFNGASSANGVRAASAAAATTAASNALPWMVGITEEGILRYETLPTPHAAPPFPQSPPITTTSDHCLLCIPFEAGRGLPKEPANDNVYASANSSTGDYMWDGGEPEEVTRALNLLFGLFTAPRPRQRSVVHATSILVTPEGAGNHGAVTVTNKGAFAGDNLVAALPSPPFSALASPNHETVGTFVFPALGQTRRSIEGGLRTSVRSCWKTPPPSFEKSVGGESCDATLNAASATTTLNVGGEAGGVGLDGRISRGQRSEPPRHGLNTTNARTTTTFLKAATDRSTHNDNNGNISTHEGDSHLSMTPGVAQDGAAADEWLCPLRQALIHRVVFVLVKSDSQPTTPPPPLLPPHSPKRRVSSSIDTDSAYVSASAQAATREAVMRNFIYFVKARYGVTVPSWRVLVFSYRDSVITRNFLLSYYAHTHASASQQTAPGTSGEETAVVVTSGGAFTDGPGNASTAASCRLGERESTTTTVDLLQPSTRPLLMNSSAEHTLQRCGVSPLTKTLVPTPPDTGVTTSAAGLRALRQGSRNNLLHSTSQPNPTNSLRASTEAALATPKADSRGSGGKVSGSVFPVTDAEEKNEAVLAVDADNARAVSLLYALLTREISVPLLPTSLATYAPFMLQSGLGGGTHPQPQQQTLQRLSSPPPCKPVPHFLLSSTGCRGPCAEENTVSTTIATGTSVTAVPLSLPIMNTAAATANCGGASDGLATVPEHNYVSSCALSVSSGSEGRQDVEPVTLTKEEIVQSTVACTHALTIMWRESGAASLNSAIRLFEHDAAAHRHARGAFLLMAWSWQLAALLPAVVREARLRCRRLRHTRRHALQKLDGVQKSIAVHVSGGPAKNVAALEMRVQGEFAAMTQRFAHDVRRLLIAPSTTLSPSSTASAGAGEAQTASSSVSASSAAANNSTTALSSSMSRQATPATYPPLDALRVYETPALHEAYRRLVCCVRRFRDFYIHGLLPAGACCERKGLSRDTAVNSLWSSLYEQSGEPVKEGDAGVCWNASLYEARYVALHDNLTAPASPTSAAGQKRQKEACVISLANTSHSTKAVSVSPDHPPPPASKPVSNGPHRNSRSALPPLPPPLCDKTEQPHCVMGMGVLEEHRMPSVDRSAPRECCISHIAGVGSSGLASSLNTSSASRSQPSLSEATAPCDTVAVTTSPPNKDDKNKSSSSTPSSVSPRKLSLVSRTELQKCRLLMERQLIAHVSQLNTELINFFLATCVAALPHIQRSCVQAEIERVKASYAEVYSSFVTTVHSHKDAAMSMAQAYASLEQWAAEVGPLLSIVRSRRYLEKFIVQLRAVLCEDQIRGLAVFRSTRDGTDPCQMVQLTNANLARHCTATAKTDQKAQLEVVVKAPGERISPGKESWMASAGVVKSTLQDPKAALPTTTEVGIRSGRLLLYYTRLACKPAVQVDLDNGGGRNNSEAGTASVYATSSLLRPGRATSVVSASVTSHASFSRNRNHGLGDTVSLTSMSAAWNREEESVAGNAGRHKIPSGSNSSRSPQLSQPAAAGSELVNDGFYATPGQSNMSAVSAQLMAALGGATAMTTGAATTTSMPLSSVELPDALSFSQLRQRSHTEVDMAEESLLTSSGAPSPQAASHSNRRRSTQRSSSKAAAESLGVTSNDGAAVWRTRLAKWRSRLSEVERPTDIAAAPLLWLLLDTWDETVLRFPYGLILHLDAARYADSLNALSTPIMVSQLNYKAKLTESARSAARQLAALEEDVKRLVGEDGEVRADYLAALRSIFDDATTLATPGDDTVHASFFS